METSSDDDVDMAANESFEEDWDTFITRPADNAHSSKNSYLKIAIVVAKVLSYILFFLAVLGSAIGSKMALIILASNTMHHGNDTATHAGNSTSRLCTNSNCGTNGSTLTTLASPIVQSGLQNIVNEVGKAERAKYMLMLMGTILVPEVMTVLRNIVRIIFSKMKGPSWGVLWKVCLVEALSTSGICIFVLRVLPRSNFIFSLLLMNGVCFVPAILKIHATIVRKDIKVGFALPLCLATPATMVMFVIDCQWRNVFKFNSLNIWECDVDLEQSWREIIIGIVLWWLSQLWISSHIWFRSNHRFAPTSKMFVRPMYCGGLVEQSLMLNRKSKDENEARTGSNVTKIVTDVVAAPVDSVIYLCATMWHETEEEMVQILKSICRMDLDQANQASVPDMQRDNYRCETHILFDDAMDLRDDGKLVVNDFVRQLCRLVPTAANAVRDRGDQVTVPDPTVTPTPYGGQLVWRLPGGHVMVAHLKDKMRIRHRKRWSQTLYKLRCDNTYILALDGDVDFQPSAVQLLVDLMKRNPQVGAACGRIHPIGSGPLIWYQMFEYAIGHWFQKTAEHVLGCVLCSPGCFSLFRATAIMDDNVMHKYTTKPTEAKHFVQYDQGEDRWLCTLMLQQGWRVEYSAASDAFTYAPEGFKEFFNQRRRWGPSTMANVMDLLLDGRRTAKINSSISNLYIIYQMAMMISSVLGPATVCMMIAGALTYAFKWDNVTAMAVSVAPPVGFIILCFVVKPDTQINVAAILSAMYSCVMMAVVVGIAGQITVEGPLSPVALFTFLMCGLFLIAAIIHPQEFWNIACGALYLLCVPSGYLLLIIYSLCNMNIVSWGTREVKKKGSTKKAAGGPQPKTAKERFMQLFKGGDDDDSGYLCGCGNLFKCEMCPRSKRQDDYLPLVEALDKVYSRAASRTVSRLSVSRAASRAASRAGSRRSVRRVSFSGDNDLSSDIEEELIMDDIFQEELLKEEERPLADEEPEIDQDYWLTEDVFASCPVQHLEEGETKFWRTLIAKYLHPLEEDKQEQERIAGELKSLRNKVTFGFFMLNALWMIVTFVLQINTKDLYVPYKLPDGTELKVEALGLAFLTFFIIVLVIQFVSMVFHRFSTLIHILAATELSCCRKKKAPRRRAKRTSVPTINVDEAASQLADDISQQPIVRKITVSPAPARRGSHQTNRRRVSSGRRLSREQGSRHQFSSGRRLSRDQMTRNHAQQPRRHSNRRRSRRESNFGHGSRNKRRSSSLVSANRPSSRSGGIHNLSQSLLSVRPGHSYPGVQRNTVRKQRLDPTEGYQAVSMNASLPQILVVDHVDVLNERDSRLAISDEEPATKPTVTAHISRTPGNAGHKANEPKSTDMEKSFLPIQRTEWDDSLHREVPTTIQRPENIHDSRSTISSASPLPEYIDDAEVIIKEDEIPANRLNPDHATDKGQRRILSESEAVQSGSESDDDDWDWTVPRRDNLGHVLPSSEGSDVKTASHIQSRGLRRGEAGVASGRSTNPLRIIKRKVFERKSRRLRRNAKV
ncbi:chitin synthase I [Branchiostoma belcheri]|nr:chitin synthase I [Branchiostoma belcheri]